MIKDKGRTGELEVSLGRSDLTVAGSASGGLEDNRLVSTVTQV